MLELIERIRTLAVERAKLQREMKFYSGRRRKFRVPSRIVDDSAAIARQLDAAFVELAKHSRSQADALRLEIIANQASKEAKA